MYKKINQLRGFSFYKAPKKGHIQPNLDVTATTNLRLAKATGDVGVDSGRTPDNTKLLSPWKSVLGETAVSAACRRYRLLPGAWIPKGFAFSRCV